MSIEPDLAEPGVVLDVDGTGLTDRAPDPLQMELRGIPDLTARLRTVGRPSGRREDHA